MTPRAIGYAFVTAVIALHAVVAWHTPLQGDDWGHWMWASGDEGVLGVYATASDLVGFAAARSTIFHAIATPLAGLALVLGAYAFAVRRLPRLDTWDEVLGIALLGALIWITTPRAALVWFHRPYAATWIYGMAAALWVLMPLRCGWQPRGAWVPALAAAGVVAASFSRQLAVIALIYAIVVARRMAPRPAWVKALIAGLVAGGVLVFLDRPAIDFRGFRLGFEGSLGGVGLSLREGGELIALVLGLAMLRLTLARLRPQWGNPGGVPDTTETLRWLWVWFGLSVLALFGPRYSEATLSPAALALCIAAMPLFRWLVEWRPMRVVVILMTLGIHVVVWTLAVATYLQLGREYQERMAIIERTPPGGVAVIAPYSKVEPGFWSFGEDWAGAGSRQLIAIELFGLRDIDFTTPFKRYEPNPGLAIEVEATGASEPPPQWASAAVSARGQFEDWTKRARPASARLLVTSVRHAVLRDRPVQLATFDGDEVTTFGVVRRALDDYNEQALAIRPRSLTQQFSEAYVLVGGRATSITFERGAYRVPVMTTELHVVIACAPTTCFLVDAFVPQL